VILPLLPFDLWAPCKASWVWAGAVKFALVTCSLQFAKASAATPPQQEKNNSADMQRDRANITGFICTVVS
jgi:non-homologous end joining protein Ku